MGLQGRRGIRNFRGAPAGRPISYLMCLLYFHTNQDLSDCNLDLLTNLGSVVRAMHRPFVVGADWNMLPDGGGRFNAHETDRT